MKSQPEIYAKNTPSFTVFMVNCGFTKMKTFGDRLKEKMNEVGITAAELSRRSGVTKQNIGRLINNTPHSITGALPKTEESTVLKLAKALNWDSSDALLAAGYAPSNSMDSYNILEGVTIQFNQSVNLSKKGKEKILNAVKLIAIGVKAEQEHELSQKDKD